LPARHSWELLRSGLPFHWDVYGLSLPETLSFAGDWPYSQTRADARRKDVRYAIMARAAHRIWVSDAYQMVFVAALLARTGDVEDARTAFSLPTKTIQAPMGCRTEPFPTGSENPYLAQGIEGPVFLWGGGVWKWFDLRTVVEAFGELARTSRPGSLFFLAGRNESTPDYDGPLETARRLADGLGVGSDRIHFNKVRVGPEDLAPWLEHCGAGIMANCQTIESALSWRTRYLDLLWAGRPLVVSGTDPLAERMERAGAALVASPAGAVGLAQALAGFTSEEGLREKMSEASSRLGQELSSRCTMASALESLKRPGKNGKGPGPLELARYILGR